MNSHQDDGGASGQSCCFVEIRREEDMDGSARKAPDEVEVYVSSIQPLNCGKAIKELSAVLPLRLPEKGRSSSNDDICLGHLKRVRRPNVFATEQTSEKLGNDPSSGDKIKGVEEATSCISKGHFVGDTGNTSFHDPSQKRKKRRRSSDTESRNGTTESAKQKDRPGIIEIIVGTTIRVDAILEYDGKDVRALSIKSNLRRILDHYDLTLEKRCLPGRPAKSQIELDEWNCRSCPAYIGKGWWPTIFFNKRTEEYREEERKLSLEEIRQMQTGMKAAIADGRAFRATSATVRAVGAAIIDPINGKIVSTACEERELQQRQLIAATAASPEAAHSKTSTCVPDEVNPLCSSVILAIQSVSRKERNAAKGKGMDSDDFKNGQYLCTG